MTGAGFVASGVNAGAASVVGGAVKVGSFVEDVARGDAVGGSDAIDSGGEGAARVKGLDR